MESDSPPTPETVRAARIRIPEHVVYRTFPTETVVLNLETGKYHGLNSTGGDMLEALERFGAISQAATQLAEDYAHPRDEIERDLCQLCIDLAERGLIELDDE